MRRIRGNNSVVAPMLPFVLLCYTNFAMLVTDSLTNCRLVNSIDVTLTSEYAYSKLVEVNTVDNVSNEAT